MKNRQKTWMGVGLFALAGTSLSTATDAVALGADQPSISRADAPATPAAPEPRTLRLAQEGGEGGEGGGEGGEGSEGGEGGGAIESYSLLSTDANAFKYDAKPEVAAYADGVYASYAAAVASAVKLKGAVEALLANPTDETLAAARKAWAEARPAYLVTETFRFYDGPIEDLEGQINAWPMNEAFIDYVVDKPKAGIINDTSEVTIAELIAKNQVTDEADVTIGWHAVEFLLWGQDLSADGPGNRPVSDFIAGQGNNDRRRAYLQSVTEQLVGDIEAVQAAWAPGADNYRTKFLALPEREAVGRIMNGMAVLAGFEFMSERLAVALDSGDQEDEHSCFSDTTHQDFVYDLKGIENVWKGTYPNAAGPGIEALVAKVDPALATEVTGLLADATAKVGALGDPWDKVLAAPADSAEKKAAEAAVEALQKLGDGLKRAGGKLGVLVQIPTG